MAESRFELYERSSGTRLASGTLRNLAEQLGSAGTSYTSVIIRARKLHGEDVALSAIAPEYQIADYLDGVAATRAQSFIRGRNWEDGHLTSRQLRQAVAYGMGIGQASVKADLASTGAMVEQLERRLAAARIARDAAILNAVDGGMSITDTAEAASVGCGTARQRVRKMREE